MAPMRSNTAVKDDRSGKSGSGKRRGKAKGVLERPAIPGWLTTDDDEMELRRWRGRTEILDITALEPDLGLFGAFRARSASGGSYEVEIRSLASPENSCGCADHAVNGLGTCKHVEGTLAALHRKGAKAYRAAEKAGSPRVEVFLDRRGAATPRVVWPAERHPAAIEWLRPWLDDGDTLASDPAAIEGLLSAWGKASPDVRACLRVSRHFGPWIERARRERARVEARAAFQTDVATGRASLDILKHRLLPYQELGVLHLAFGERALLADDMGLGKTIQAIGACELLARRRGIGKVLVVAPTSLKAEWEEQIARFCDRTTRLVFGPRPQRLAAYAAEPAFFTVVNYEQVLNDFADINTLLRPDVVVLDEAQRIKNWQTKTARCVKSLRAPYAFVLTGTPVENRIDELYSIVQYLDPEVLGPLFRFNREFYELDERGRPMDYKNLAELRARLQPLMLRRRKADVEKELPGRTVKTFFVAMAEEQAARYEDFRAPAAQLIARAQQRPLRQQEFDRLQQLLACMRMTCDTTAILDPTTRISPKLEELEKILGDLLEDPDTKVIVFSEWERMLQLVRELVGEMGFEAAWHTGSVPQVRRRAEINRFKNDPNCRLFLSTDSGSTGLNLQVASAVVNVDLPWNPAKLEQRIARAWRKNQMRSVRVVNLVAEGTIEHSIMHLLGQKQALADGVLDGAGDLAELKMPSGRGAFIERMQAMMASTARTAPRVLSAEEALVSNLFERHGDKLLRVEERRGPDGRSNLLVVLDGDAAAIAAEADTLGSTGEGVVVEVVERGAWLAMQRLAAAGLLRFVQEPRVLHRAPSPDGEAEGLQVDGRAAEAMAEADKAMRMAKVLAAGGFPEEAPALLVKALEKTAMALMTVRGETTNETAVADVRYLVEHNVLGPEALDVLDAAYADTDFPEVASLVTTAGRILSEAARNEPKLRAM